MRLRFIALLILIAVVVSLTGCARLSGEPTEEIVEATIIETRFYGSQYVPVRSGKTTTMVLIPPKYYTILQYKDITTSIYGSELYSICRGRNGDTIQCTLITESYDDGSVKQFLEWRK